MRVSVQFNHVVTIAPPSSKGIADAIEGVLANFNRDDDLLEAKIAPDRMVDPHFDPALVRTTIARLAAEAERLNSPDARPDRRLAALRQVLYVSGPWNDGRPFSYDLENDPTGQSPTARLLHNYLRTRLGNCISMPILFLILGDHIGLDVTLANAPLHVFVRYTSEAGKIVNIEATSGGHLCRDEWLRHNMPMTDRAVASGIYLRSLSRRECVSLMASTVLEHLSTCERWSDVFAVADILMREDPLNVYAMIKKAHVAGLLQMREFEDLYSSPLFIPPVARPRYAQLAGLNHQLFTRAEQLGWEPVPI